MQLPGSVCLQQCNWLQILTRKEAARLAAVHRWQAGLFLTGS